ncbi:hypothetical protein [Hansschlegelia plantiphila]|uniref:Uncharacterized protein n=1 Tax=Hansschlegelia plantiphila TaxID=374655 RepID=A0A9W6MV98_9HYPH|nr:hypothetical protein [Hansschlegelia plantiphila]GLK67661.1 hypothetical protein GCM10008179_12990 [Hansschlegelia plantiphila]
MTEAAPSDDPALKKLATLAVLAVALGFAVQVAVLAAKLAAGGPFPGIAFAADVAGGVAWSGIVCLGAGIGTALYPLRASLAGLVAALFAPVAVAVSKAANQVVASAIRAVDQPAAASLIGLAAVKAVEYGLLGFLLATLAARGAKLPAFLGTGAAVGLTFGAAALALRWGGAPAAELAATAVNEMVFPVGCAAVVYAGTVVGGAK